MQIDVAKYCDFLGVFITVTTPTTDVAVDPASAEANFYTVDDNGALLAVPGVNPTALTKQGGATGIWGCFVDASLLNVNGLVIIATAVVGATARSAIKIFGNSNVGGPKITVTPGIYVDEAKL